MLLELQKVSKTYDDSNEIMPLREMDLSLAQGDFVSVSGESGVGKSTLLFVVSGLLRPSSGEVLFQGKRYSEMSDDALSRLRAGNIGYVSQNIQLAQALTVEENIRFAQKIAKKCGSDAGTMVPVDEIIAHLGLTEKKDELPRHLSGGQKRRAMLAVTWARNPQLLLLDEPTNDLDDHWSNVVMELLDRWHEDGKTLLLVTHNQEFAGRAKKRYHLVNGKVSE